MSYKSTRRQWVKLWVNEWLDGTTRFKLTQRQRLLWVDLLAMAGRSRWPGEIFAGYGESNARIGYPLSWLAGTLGFEVTELNNALIALNVQGHISLDLYDEAAVIRINNWEKYQSEYLRQKGYRKVTTKRTSRLPVEGERDVEGEKEVEVVATASAAAWTSIGFAKPIGHKSFRSVWEARFQTKGEKEWLTDVMERTIQDCEHLGVKVPPPFFEAKRAVETEENAMFNPKRVPL